jgi:hypothetical protein
MAPQAGEQAQGFSMGFILALPPWLSSLPLVLASGLGWEPSPLITQLGESVQSL